MNQSAKITQFPETERRHRPREGMGLFVTDRELADVFGVPYDTTLKPALAALDAQKSGFPQKVKLWGDRRYLPAVRAWLDHNYSGTIAALKPRGSQ